MHKYKTLYILFVGVLLFFSIKPITLMGQGAAVVYVDVNAPQGGDGTPENPYKKIQVGIDNAVSYTHLTLPTN